MSISPIALPGKFFSSREGAVVDMLVLHYTGTRTGQDALDILSGKTGREVSSHYTVDEDGTIYAHVKEQDKAWHAGLSHWQGVDNVNAFSIGIEIVNPGHEWGYRAFPKSQMVAVLALCKDILSRHAIPPRRVVAHSDVAPARKEDPGELFDWKWLAENGVGVWPNGKALPRSGFITLREGDAGAEVGSLQRRLAEWGYGIPISHTFCVQTREVVVAFQRHFRQSSLTGEWDGQCDALLEDVLRQVMA